MSDLELEGRCNVFTAIPPAGGWFDGQQINSGSDGKSDPPENVVQFLVLFHKTSKLLLSRIRVTKVQILIGTLQK
jgi:hypothetical protein